jgi:hypothetical protein
MKSQVFLKRMFSVFVLVLLLVFSSAAVAQETTGGIQGVVKDPQGAVVPGAAIPPSTSTRPQTAAAENNSMMHLMTSIF